MQQVAQDYTFKTFHESMLKISAGMDSRYADLIIGSCAEYYDAIEVHGVRDLNEPDDPQGTCCEVDDEHPQFFSVYVHLKEGGVECVGDFGSVSLARSYAVEMAGKFNWPVHDFVRS